MKLTFASSLVIGVQIAIAVLANDSVIHTNELCSIASDCEPGIKDQDWSERRSLGCDEFIECVRNTFVHRKNTYENITELVKTRLSYKLCSCALYTSQIDPRTRGTDCNNYQTVFRVCKRVKHLCFQIELGHIEYSNIVLPHLCKALLQCSDDVQLFSGIVDFPADITTFCPTGKFCFVNRTTSPSKSSDNQGSMCTCSCEYDCGKTGSCCFPEIDYYTYGNDLDKKRRCEYVNLDIGSLGIYLIATCWNESPCSGETKPVSDPVHQLIYLNEGCAMCNCLYEFQVWEIGLICQTSDTSELSALNVDDLKPCTDIFITPDRQLILHNTCKYVGKECDSMHKDQRTSAFCESIVAPMLLYESIHIDMAFGNVYKNPYCAWCGHKKYFQQNDAGLERLLYLSDIHITRTVRYIQISDVITQYRKSKPQRKLTSYCMASTGKCFDVHCPAVMVRIQDTCKHFIKTIVDASVSLLLKLRPLTTWIPTDLIKVPQRLGLNSWILSHCAFKYPEEGNKVYLVEEMRNGLGYVKEILTWSVYRTHITLRTFLPMLENCFSQQWELMIGNTSIMFTAQLSKHKMYVIPEENNQGPISEQQGDTSSGFDSSDQQGQITSNSRISGQQGHVSDGHPDTEHVHLLADTSYTSFDVQLYITKLLFCEQVDISWLEVTLFDGQLTVRHNSKVIGDGEYRLIRGKVFLVRMCLEDYLSATDCGRAVVATATINIVVFVCQSLRHAFVI